MNTQEKERRRFKRLFFSKKDEIIAYIILPGHQDKPPLEASVMNMSEEGICLTYRKNKDIKVTKGSIIHMVQVIGINPELSVNGLQIEVRWIMDEDFFDHDQIGCKILNTSDELRKEIREIDAPGVDNER